MPKSGGIFTPGSPPMLDGTEAIYKLTNKRWRGRVRKENWYNPGEVPGHAPSWSNVTLVETLRVATQALDEH